MACSSSSTCQGKRCLQLQEGTAAGLLARVLGVGLAHLPRVTAQAGIDAGPVQRLRKALQGGHAHPHLRSTPGTCWMPHVCKKRLETASMHALDLLVLRTSDARQEEPPNLASDIWPRHESQVSFLDVHQCRARVHQQRQLRQLVVAFFVRLLANQSSTMWVAAGYNAPRT